MIVGSFDLTSLLADLALQMQERNSHPVTFRLPSKGTDPYFGLTRSFYYAAESQGLLSLIRLRSKGKRRGVTLVRAADVLALIEEAAQAG